MLKQPIYRRLAARVDARARSARNNNRDWFNKHTDAIKSMVKRYMPSGSGFDVGTSIDLDASNGEKLVFSTSFHHHAEHGYDGWTEHTVTVTASLLLGIEIKISGQNKADIKEHIHEAFYSALTEEIEADDEIGREVTVR
jgi:hypothetical protein